MSAKDYFRADIASVYQNTEEFAETVKINGIEILAIPDGELLQQRTRQNYGNIAVGDVLLHIAETEWDKILRLPPSKGGRGCQSEWNSVCDKHCKREHGRI